MFADQYASWDWPTPSLVGLRIFAPYLTVFESEQNMKYDPQTYVSYQHNCHEKAHAGVQRE
jgi:hypothetical protein